jgi:probable rRNA maturation factor
MISFNYETDFELDNEILFSEWISKIIVSENKTEGEINYIFCDDDYLHKINLEYLQHDDLTDIISFDYSVGNELHGDIFISIERVKENAADYDVTFNEELKRVMAHGVLHYAGYKDKTEKDAGIMRTKENEKIALFDN